MHDRDSESKSKLEVWHFPRLIELRYPTRIAKTGDKLNWIASMMVDPRLSERDRLVLTRLAMHLNPKNGRCDPAERLLALELSIGGKEESATPDRTNGCPRPDKYPLPTGLHSPPNT